MKFGETIELLNDQYAHEEGFHLSTLNMSLFPEELCWSDTAHDLMAQTYDWRWNEPDKDEYTVVLSAENMRYIGNAIEAYQKTMSELYIEPKLRKIATSLMEGKSVSQ